MAARASLGVINCRTISEPLLKIADRNFSTFNSLLLISGMPTTSLNKLVVAGGQARKDDFGDK
jgi:hypothetical protein